MRARRLLGLGPIALIAAACVPDFHAAPPAADAGTDGGPADAPLDTLSPDTASDALPPPSESGADGSPASVSLQGCVLLFHMDEAAWPGVSSVKDSSSAKNDGTPAGTVSTTPDGKFGGAGSFTGNGYVDVPDSTSLNPTTALTYAAWIYPTGLGNDQLYPGIVSKRQAFGADVAFDMFIWTGLALWVDIQGNRFSSNAKFGNNQWYHVAVVFDGSLPAASRASIYVNGKLDSAHGADAALAAHAADLTVGYLPQGGSLDPNAYFIGRIDEVAVWNRALGADEVMALAGATGPL